MNYELTLGVPAVAVGLSAISFSAALQKDAASIPNAGRLPRKQIRERKKIFPTDDTNEHGYYVPNPCKYFRFAKKKQRQKKTPTFARVNQRREVNYRAIQPHELSTETVLFSFPLNGRANYICRFRDLIKDVVSSTPG